MRNQLMLEAHQRGGHLPDRIMHTGIRLAHFLGLASRPRQKASQSYVVSAPPTAPAAPVPNVPSSAKPSKIHGRAAPPQTAVPKRRKIAVHQPQPDYAVLAQLSARTASPIVLSKAEIRASWDLAIHRARLGITAQATWANSVPPEHQSETDRMWDEAFRKTARR
jgi:hypothetical protein